MNVIKKSLDYWNNLYENIEIDNIKVDNWLDSYYGIIKKCKTPILY